MDEFGDWIYIILMVVVGISSLFSSISKKKRQQQTQMPVPVPSESTFPEPSIPKQKARKQPLPAFEQSKRIPYDANMTHRVEDNRLQAETFVEQEESTLSDELDLSDADAFRKAVIYAEILNRKY